MSSAVGTQLQASISPLADLPAPRELLIDVAELQRKYFELRPDVNDPEQMVIFGTGGAGV